VHPWRSQQTRQGKAERKEYGKRGDHLAPPYVLAANVANGNDRNGQHKADYCADQENALDGCHDALHLSLVVVAALVAATMVFIPHRHL